ncbi:MAG: sulfotransferase family 2 domain-containing protein [Planctomycetales bacterium]|nr:sulfotransferase family 2 domain-containing protein [Planctomycetales bacterium]
MALSETESLVFMHIPKTGGTTLHRLLKAHFADELICPERFARLEAYSLEELSRYRFFSGHFDRTNVACIPGSPKIVTLFREPKARILSLFYYWKSHKWEVIEAKDLAGPRMAKSMRLLDFLRCPLPGITPNIDNVMTRTLLPQFVVGPNREFGMAEELVLPEATAFLDNMECFGVLEEYETTVNVIWGQLGWHRPATIPVTRSRDKFSIYSEMEEVEREDITPKIEQELDRLTRYDTQLYEYAVSQLATRKSSIPAPTPRRSVA